MGLLIKNLLTVFQQSEFTKSYDAVGAVLVGWIQVARLENLNAARQAHVTYNPD